nr:MAG TPA: hypothetical protein [Caudoviricetes sp.]
MRTLLVHRIEATKIGRDNPNHPFLGASRAHPGRLPQD